MNSRQPPEFISRTRWTLLLAFLLPQVLLLIFNLRCWQIIHAEAGGQERFWALVFLVFEAALLLSTTLVFLLARPAIIKWPILLLSLLGHGSYMWLFLEHSDDIIPWGIQTWILTEETLWQWNISLMMPAAFISLLLLSRHLLTGRNSKTIKITMTTSVIGIPALWFLAATVAQPILMNKYGEVILITASVLMMTLFLGGLCFLFDQLLIRVRGDKTQESHYLFALLVGLAAPLGGLALNTTIPFPADFQTPGVYYLTVLNALVLLLPAGGTGFAGSRLFARSLVAPFTAYFFWVFLPYLPLSLLAILAIGTGFLMLAPLALGLFQARLSWYDWLVAKQQLGGAKALAIVLVGTLCLPCLLVIESIQDKRALQISLNYFYTPNIDSPTLSDKQIQRAANALIRVRDKKEGVHLPLVSGIYQTIVLGNMTLSNSKLNSMYYWLTNEDMPKNPNGLRSSRQSRRDWNGWATPPSQDTSLLSKQLISTGEGQEELRLVLQNHSDNTHTRYVGKINLPEGVFITGMRLKISNEWVPANIFDRKTALWVFREITKVRRDPALLVYRTPNQLELQVYPFPKQGIREVALDVIRLPGSKNELTIDDEIVRLPGEHVVTVVNDNGAFLSRHDLVNYHLKRQPYLYFILYFGVGSTPNTQAYANHILSVSQQLGIPEFRISAANIEVVHQPGNALLRLTKQEDITEQIGQIPLTKRGGFWQQMALTSTLQAYLKNMSASDIAWRPVPVLLSNKKQNKHNNTNLGLLHAQIPDMTHWYEFDGETLQKHSINKEDTQENNTSVAILKSEHQWWVVAADSTRLIPAHTNSIEIWQPTSQQLKAVTMNAPSTDAPSWSVAANLWLRWLNAAQNPALLETQRITLLQESRQKSVLIPTTAWIAVERASQTVMLKRKEQKSLNNHSALSFDEQETPEPSGWILLLGLLAFLWYRHRQAHSA